MDTKLAQMILPTHARMAIPRLTRPPSTVWLSWWRSWVCRYTDVRPNGFRSPLCTLATQHALTNFLVGIW